MYSPGDLVVHPLHGVGTISKIETRRIDSREAAYYELLLKTGNVNIMIPVDGCENVGVRPVMPRETAQRLVEDFASIDAESETVWNRRYRENMVRLRSGDPYEVAKVIKSLMLREKNAGLSSGERKILMNARGILLSELTVVLGIEEDEIYAQLQAKIG